MADLNVSSKPSMATVSTSDGTSALNQPVRQVNINDPSLSIITESVANANDQLRQDISVDIGQSGTNSPAISGSGVLGWLRAIYDAVQNVTLSKINGSTIETNTGNSDNGTQRVVIATDQPQFTHPFKVDGSATTQPVSGTITVSNSDFPNTQSHTDLQTLHSDLGTQGASSPAIPGTGVIGYLRSIYDQLSSSLSTNVSKISGSTVDTNSGNKSAGTQRIVIATDQPALSNPFKVDGSAVTQPISGTVSISNTDYPSGQTHTDLSTLHTDLGVVGASPATIPGSGVVGWLRSIYDSINGTLLQNLTKLNGTTIDVNSGSKSNGTQRVVIATDQPAVLTTVSNFPADFASATTVAALATLSGKLDTLHTDLNTRLKSTGGIGPFQTLTNVTGNVIGSTCDAGYITAKWTAQINVSASLLTAGTVTLKGSMDGTNFFTMGTATLIGILSGGLGTTVASGDLSARYARAEISGLIGTSVSINAWVASVA